MRTRVVALADLDAVGVHDLLRLRQDVFVVEQDCVYPDLDGRDLEPGTRQVLLLDGDGAEERVVGCARVLDDGDAWRVGRVALHRDARGRGLGDVLVAAALQACTGPRDVVLDAQVPVVPLYARLGFEVCGAEFVEDGIPHRPMRLAKQRLVGESR